MVKQYTARRSDLNRDTSPLSFEQEHLWNRRVPNIPPMAVRMTGPLSADRFREALYGVVKRHEALRTVFKDTPVPRQVILPDPQVEFVVDDISNVSPEMRISTADRIILAGAGCPFDLQNGPLIRAWLVRLADEDHVFCFTMHHIVTDLWSFRLFFRELGVLYSASLKRVQSPLAPLQMQYADYAVWQRQWFQGDVLRAYVSYWRERLSGMRAFQMPPDYDRPAAPASRGRVESIRVSKPIAAGLRAVSRAERVTLFMTLLAAFKILLHQRTNEEDVSVSTLIANRGFPGSESIIGVFANRLILRTTMVADAIFRDLLSSVRDVCLGAYEHQHVSFWKFADMTYAEEPRSSPMILFTLQDVPVEMPEFRNLELAPLHLTGPTIFENTGMAITGRFDQSWEVWKDGDELLITVTYPSELYKPFTIRQMLVDFKYILGEVVGNASIVVSELVNGIPVSSQPGAVAGPAMATRRSGAVS